MADKDVATGTWRAGFAGIAMALVLTMAVTAAAPAASAAGKGRPEAKTQGPAHGAPGAEKGRKLGASKGQKVRRRGSAPSPTKSRGRGNAGGPTPRQATPPNSHAKAGKTTICHSTGSATNPYVEITISDNALQAHARHHDGRDIIPAPAEGCEGVGAEGVVERTGSEERESGVLGRRRANRESDVETADEPRKRRAAAGDVLGVGESNVAPQNAAQPVAEEDDEGGSLPFTGLALGALLLIAVLSVAAGAAIRRASRAELD
jgi:hypothetical protein